MRELSKRSGSYRGRDTGRLGRPLGCLSSHGRQRPQVQKLQQRINGLLDKNKALERRVQEEKCQKERLRDSFLVVSQERDDMELKWRLASDQATHQAEALFKSYTLVSERELQNDNLARELGASKQEAEALRLELWGARGGLTFMRRQLAETREELREQGEALEEAKEAHAAQQASIQALELGKKLATDQADHFFNQVQKSWDRIADFAAQEQSDLRLMEEVKAAANRAVEAVCTELTAAKEEARQAKETCQELEDDCRWQAERLDRAEDVQVEQRALIRQLKAEVDSLEKVVQTSTLETKWGKKMAQGTTGSSEGSIPSSPIAAVRISCGGEDGRELQDFRDGAPWRQGHGIYDVSSDSILMAEGTDSTAAHLWTTPFTDLGHLQVHEHLLILEGQFGLQLA